MLIEDGISLEDDFSEENTQEEPRRSTLAPSHGSQQYVNIRRQRPAITTDENVVEITTRPKSTTLRTTTEASTTTKYIPLTSRRQAH